MSDFVDVVQIDRPTDSAFIFLTNGDELYLCTAEYAETVSPERLADIVVACFLAYLNNNPDTVH